MGAGRFRAACARSAARSRHAELELTARPREVAPGESDAPGVLGSRFEHAGLGQAPRRSAATIRARGRAHGPMLDSRATTVRLCLTMGPPLHAQALLRAGVLEGTSIVCAGSRGGPFGEEVARACAALGARVTTWAQGEEAADAHVVCYDGAAAFAAKAGEREALDACLADAWESTRALVAARLLELY